MKNRKLLSFLVALAFVFSALGLVFAPAATAAVNYLEGTAIPPDPSDPNCSTVVLSRQPISGDVINVTLIIEAGDAFDEEEESPIVPYGQTSPIKSENIKQPISTNR